MSKHFFLAFFTLNTILFAHLILAGSSLVEHHLITAIRLFHLFIANLVGLDENIHAFGTFVAFHRIVETVPRQFVPLFGLQVACTQPISNVILFFFGFFELLKSKKRFLHENR